MNKKQLEIYLSKLETISKRKVKLEQYQTEGTLAAEFLMFGFEDIKDKVVADLGSGNGILGIGCLLLGAKKVYFVDIDKECIEVTKRNCIDFKNIEFFNCDVSEFNKKVDTVVMNPPFGVKNRKADKKFLEKAFEISDTVYSMHKLGSEKFVELVSIDNGFKVVDVVKRQFMIKKSYEFHKKKSYYIDIGFWKIKILFNLRQIF